MSVIRFVRLSLYILLPALMVGACERSGGSPETAHRSAAEKIFADDMIVGDVNAPVTMIEYASFTCPHCRNFHDTILPVLKEKYIDTGKLRIVYRDFPTAPVALSMSASLIARCIGRDKGTDAYFAAVDALYGSYTEMISSDSPYDLMTRIAAQLGLGGNAFQACITDQDLLAGLREKAEHGEKTYNITGTPSLLIGKTLMRSGSLEQLVADMERAAPQLGEQSGTASN